MLPEQTMGGIGCDICDMTFNSPSDLGTYLREKHI
jgi:hypothetical protein